MDRSREYRQMVSDSRIQKVWFPKEGDLIFWETSESIQFIQTPNSYPRTRCIYIPSQSWWQIKLKGKIMLLKTPDGNFWVLSVVYDYKIRDFDGSTPELTYVQAFMWVKYGEKWNNNKWVKIK